MSNISTLIAVNNVSNARKLQAGEVIKIPSTDGIVHAVKKNESLTMKVNELTSYENLNSVLKDMGLAYNNENIIVVK